MWRLLVLAMIAGLLQSCSTLLGMFTAPEAVANSVAMAGAETLTGVPVSEAVGIGESLGSIDQVLSDNPDASNREELEDLREYIVEQGELETGLYKEDHVPTRVYDRRRQFDTQPSYMKAVYDEDGNLVSVEAGSSDYQGFVVESELPSPYRWQRRSRDSWRFNQPRRYQLERRVTPGSQERLVPMIYKQTGTSAQ